jgi:hypothetical protein
MFFLLLLPLSSSSALVDVNGDPEKSSCCNAVMLFG